MTKEILEAELVYSVKFGQSVTRPSYLKPGNPN